MKNMMQLQSERDGELPLHHGRGVKLGKEISVTSRFDYMFPRLARDPESLVAKDDDTPRALAALGDAMFEKPNDGGNPFDSDTPAIFTYLGQFIDHDITANTDRKAETETENETPITKIEPIDEVKPKNPDDVVDRLANGRRPQLDLDNLYGDGPVLIDRSRPGSDNSLAQKLGLFENDLTMRVQRVGDGYDVPRDAEGRALIADMRNDENVIVSQLQAAMLLFHNAVARALPASLDKFERYVRARQLCRWAYQYVVVNEYLPTVCAPTVVHDVVRNGPRFVGPNSGQTSLFMPLEFSVAAFRFGHSMIRPEYRLNKTKTETIDKLLEPANASNGHAPVKNGQLQPEFHVDWSNFVTGGENVQMARRFDPSLADGLKNVLEEAPEAALKQLSTRNLLRGYNLSIPTGQAVASAMGFEPLDEFMVTHERTEKFREALERNAFKTRSPLFYYVLREAFVQASGKHLGEVGSRLVAETLVSMVQQDTVSYMNQRHEDAVRDDGIRTPAGRVSTIADILTIAGVYAPSP